MMIDNRKVGVCLLIFIVLLTAAGVLNSLIGRDNPPISRGSHYTINELRSEETAPGFFPREYVRIIRRVQP